MEQSYQILLFYTYVYIEDPALVRDWLFSVGKEYGFKGRAIVAREGLNITLEGTTENTESFIKELTSDDRFKTIHFKKSPGTGKAFPKWSVKVRDEIVTLGLGVCDINPNEITGKRLAPSELHQWFMEEKEFYIVDMRNVYEHAVGKFEGSICPTLENFRDLPKLLRQIAHLKDKTVVTVCTGGVRCEKASGYLVQQGFSDVWQLDGGIVSYMEQYPNEHFQGKLYVFDRRTLMGFYTDDPKHKIIGTCTSCKTQSEHFVDCGAMWCGNHFILCEACTKASTINGVLTCPQGCKLRRPNKLHSPFQKVFLTIKTFFTHHGRKR